MEQESNSKLDNVAFSLNLVFLIMACITFLIDIYAFARFCQQFKQKNQRITILYSSHTYLMLLCYTVIIIWMSLGTLLGDLNISTWDNSGLTFLCRLRTFLCFMFLLGIYSSFVVQTVFRLFRLMFSRYTWFLTGKCFALIFLLNFVTIALLSIFFAVRAIFHPSDHFCLGTFDDFILLGYSLTIMYILPIGSILIMYVIIIRHTRRSPRMLTILTARRDILVVRRIILLITSLLILALPPFALWILYLMTGTIYPLAYRIAFMMNSVAIAILSVVTAFITPPRRIFAVRKRATVHLPRIQ